jgi:hypothetical protein
VDENQWDENQWMKTKRRVNRFRRREIVFRDRKSIRRRRDPRIAAAQRC